MQNSKISMVIFDMAGTTVNENNLVYKTLMRAINSAGFNISLNQVLEQGAGKEKKQAIRSIIGTFAATHDELLVEGIYDKFIIELTDAYEKEEIFPQPNAVEVLKELKARNIVSVLNTGYDRKTACAILSKLGWKQGIEFDALVTASDVKGNRPDPDMINFAMKKFNIIDSRRIAKVGDSTIDIHEGHNAGCGLSIGITTGAHTTAQLKTANPDHVINDLSELLNIMDEVI